MVAASAGGRASLPVCRRHAGGRVFPAMAAPVGTPPSSPPLVAWRFVAAVFWGRAAFAFPPPVSGLVLVCPLEAASGGALFCLHCAGTRGPGASATCGSEEGLEQLAVDAHLCAPVSPRCGCREEGPQSVQVVDQGGAADLRKASRGWPAGASREGRVFLSDSGLLPRFPRPRTRLCAEVVRGGIP